MVIYHSSTNKSKQCELNFQLGKCSLGEGHLLSSSALQQTERPHCAVPIVSLQLTPLCPAILAPAFSILVDCNALPNCTLTLKVNLPVSKPHFQSPRLPSRLLYPHLVLAFELSPWTWLSPP